MNYLGHLLITYPDKALTMGNLLGDMLRARQYQEMSDPLRKGIEIHHFIDHFTDAHDGIRRLVELVRPVHAKYAPVVVDILLDHALAIQWDMHSDISYKDFTDWVYHKMVPAHVMEIEPRVSGRIRSMASGRWLDGYPTQAGMQYVLTRMDCRTAFPSRFGEAMNDFGKNHEEFIGIFNEFYPELKAACLGFQY